MSIRALNQDEKLMEIKQSELDELRVSVHGEVIVPSDAQYDSVRQIWNAMIQRKPALIVRCTGTADVIAVVKFAAECRECLW